MVCSPQIDRRAVAGVLEILHAARQQPVSRSPSPGRRAGWWAGAAGTCGELGL